MFIIKLSLIVKENGIQNSNASENKKSVTKETNALIDIEIVRHGSICFCLVMKLVTQKVDYECLIQPFAVPKLTCLKVIVGMCLLINKLFLILKFPSIGSYGVPVQVPMSGGM